MQKKFFNGAPAASNEPQGDDTLGHLSHSIFLALKAGKPVDALLDDIHSIIREKTWRRSRSESLLQTWSACVALLEDDCSREPEVSARALYILRSLSHLCNECGNAVYQDWAQLDIAVAVFRSAKWMRAHPQAATLQTAGCALLSRLAGCSSCQTSHASGLLLALGSAGAVAAAADAVCRLEGWSAEPAAAVCSVEALAALRFLAVPQPANLQVLAECGGVALVQKARRLAKGHGASEQHAVALFGALACQADAPPAAAQAAAAAVWEVAQRCCAAGQEASPEVTKAVAVCMVDISRALLTGSDVWAEGMAVAGAGYAASLIEGSSAKDHPTVIYALAFLLTLLRPAEASSTLAAAIPLLFSLPLKLAVADVACKALEITTQADALRVLWYLLHLAPHPAHASPALTERVVTALSTLYCDMPTVPPSAKPAAASALVHAVGCLVRMGHQPMPAAQALLALSQSCAALTPGIGGAEWDEATVAWGPLEDTVRATVDSLLLSEGTVNYVDVAGYTLIHHLACRGLSRCLGVVLECGGASIDLLVRTKNGATALQLAKEYKHAKCAAMLEEVTQRAAEARQAALLQELDDAETSRKAKKKKAVTRSASFVAEQPDEKAQKLVAEGSAMAAAAAAAAAATQAMQERELRQRLEEDYESALEKRRQELAEQAAAAVAAVAAASTVPISAAAAPTASSTGVENTEDSPAELPTTPRALLEASANGGGSSGPDDSEALLARMESDGNSADVTMQSPFEAFAAASSASLFAPASALNTPDAIAPLGALQQQQQNQQQQQQQQREHSLFGSPSLTGNLFSGSLPSATASPATSFGFGGLRPVGFGAAGLPSADLAELTAGMHGLPPLPSMHGMGSDVLSDALFVQPSPMPSPGAAPMKQALNGCPGHQIAPQMSGSTDGSLAYASLARSTLSPSLTAGMSSLSGTGSDDADSDTSPDPTRHLWIGNLSTRISRAGLKAVFEAHGVVDDVVTFPGRMYAFVNFSTSAEAEAAAAALQDQVVPDLTGDRPLLLKYRPVRKAAAHLRAGGGSDSGDIVDGLSGNMGTRDGEANSSDPSPRIWLGNIAPTATSKTLQAVLGRFGPLNDAAVFPARIGPLGYAFVKFESVEDAVRAMETLNNTVVPPLSGSKQLKMRYKPAGSGPPGREEPPDATKGSSVPSRHLWLGNVTQKPSEDIVYQTFARFGRVDSARVFPAKAYAFVNFGEVSAAARAMAELDGVSIPVLTGVKPLVMRFQQENQQPVRMGSGALPRVHSESVLTLAASLNQHAPGAGGGGVAGLSTPLSSRADSEPSGGVPGSGMPPHMGDWRMDVTASHGGMGAGMHAGMHRSQSLNLVSGAVNSNRLPPSLYSFGAQPTRSSSLATASQLSAVLNNLAALQRVAGVESLGSGGIASTGPPPRHPSPQVTAGLISAPSHDIARLSSMLASQSLTSSHDAPLAMPPSLAPPTAIPRMPSLGGMGGGGWQSSGMEGLLCPLSNQLMTDPVIAADGVTYNRPAIADWVARQSISPITQTQMPHAALMPNQAVREAVHMYLELQLRATT